MNIVILGNSESVVSFLNGLKVKKSQKISIISYKKKFRPKNSIELIKIKQNIFIILYFIYLTANMHY